MRLHKLLGALLIGGLVSVITGCGPEATSETEEVESIEGGVSVGACSTGVYPMTFTRAADGTIYARAKSWYRTTNSVRCTYQLYIWRANGERVAFNHTSPAGPISGKLYANYQCPKGQTVYSRAMVFNPNLQRYEGSRDTEKVACQ
jgi:hypothetical protein